MRVVADPTPSQPHGEAITPAGLAALKAELEELETEGRARWASACSRRAIARRPEGERRVPHRQGRPGAPRDQDQAPAGTAAQRGGRGERRDARHLRIRQHGRGPRGGHRQRRTPGRSSGRPRRTSQGKLSAESPVARHCSGTRRANGGGGDTPRVAQVPDREARFLIAERDSPRSCSPVRRRATPSPSPSGCWPFRARTRAGFRLAVRARTTGLAAADVDRALTDDRALLVTWLNRGYAAPGAQRGLSLGRRHALTTPPLAEGSSRCASHGSRRLARRCRSRRRRGSRAPSPTRGPLTRLQKRERAPRRPAALQGPGAVHILMLPRCRD